MGEQYSTKYKATVRYLDFCLPDYFKGYGIGDALAVHVYALPVDGTERTWQVKQALLEAVAAEEIFVEVPVYKDLVDDHMLREEHYDLVETAVRKLFEDKHPLTRVWDIGPFKDCYACFGVRIYEE